MKYSLLALPALLRPLVLQATASQHSFSVSDDIFAFPQYEVRFSDDYLTEPQARLKLEENPRPDHSAASTAAAGAGAPSRGVGKYQASNADPSGEGKDDHVPAVEYTSMILEGQRYLCEIPQISPSDANQDGSFPNNANNETTTQAEKELELARAADRGWELLRGMQGSCVYFISGWWSYKFCYNDGVKQFHQLPPSKGVPIYPPIEDPGVDSYLLGKYQPIGTKREKDDEDAEQQKKKTVEDGAGELVQRGDSRYLVQRLDGGTTCDLTGKERRIEVQFHCNPQSADKISLIKEISTCAYLMVIQTPRLCNDVAFQPPQENQPNAITCQAVLAEDQIANYVKDVKSLRKAEKEAQIWAANSEAAQIFLGTDAAQGTLVGDIVVGANSLVPEDLKLEKSWIVGGAPKLIDTVATSEGRLMSREEIKKLGLGDYRTVERLAQELEKVAQGRGWKLEVVEARGQREYRGTFNTDDEEEEEEEGGTGAAKKQKDGAGAAKKQKGDAAAAAAAAKAKKQEDDVPLNSQKFFQELAAQARKEAAKADQQKNQDGDNKKKSGMTTSDKLSMEHERIMQREKQKDEKARQRRLQLEEKKREQDRQRDQEEEDEKGSEEEFFFHEEL